MGSLLYGQRERKSAFLDNDKKKRSKRQNVKLKVAIHDFCAKKGEALHTEIVGAKRGRWSGPVCFNQACQTTYRT